jgi:hypothetical protein
MLLVLSKGDNMGIRLKRVAISEELDKRIMGEAKNELIRVFPKLKGMPMSRNYIIGQYIDYGLKKSIFEFK